MYIKNSIYFIIILYEAKVVKKKWIYFNFKTVLNT